MKSLLDAEDIELLKGLLGGRINAVRENKALDAAEKTRLVRSYEIALHKLSNPRLAALLKADAERGTTPETFFVERVFTALELGDDATGDDAIERIETLKAYERAV